VKLEMQIAFSGRMQPLSSETFNSLFTKQQIQGRKCPLHNCNCTRLCARR